MKSVCTRMIETLARALSSGVREKTIPSIRKASSKGSRRDWRNRMLVRLYWTEPGRFAVP